MDLGDPQDVVFLRHGLRRRIAQLAEELHEAIDDDRVSREFLHDVVGLWEANTVAADHEGDIFSLEGLVASGRPSPCHDCGRDVQPYDDDGRPVEGGWEWYMVIDEVWDAAVPEEADAVSITVFLCVGCLEARLGRQLEPGDFPASPINEPSWVDSERLAARKAARA